MAGDWETSRLGESVTHQKGFAFKSADYRPSGHPIVRVSNFTDRSIDMAECSYLDHGAVQQYDAYKLRHRDAVIATVGSWPTNPASVVGKTICVPKKAEAALLNQNAVCLRSKPDLDQRFLFYLLKQPDFQSYIVGTAQGSASQASITLNDIFGFEFQRPPLAEQKAIATVLGALDDKIEINRQMNGTLEAMARALFQSWFVDFDPVRAKLDGRKPEGLDEATTALFPDSFQDSELGHIPKGWEVVSLEALASIRGGKQLPTENCLPTGKFNVFGANGTMGYTAESTHDGFVIAFGRVGAYCGSIHWSLEGAWINNNASAVIPLQWPAFVLQTMLNIDFNSMRTGSAQPFIPNSSLASAKVLRPSSEVVDTFSRIVEQWRRQQAKNNKQSRILATLRDTLLPKLLNGDLSVDNIKEGLVA